MKGKFDKEKVTRTLKEYFNGWTGKGKAKVIAVQCGPFETPKEIQVFLNSFVGKIYEFNN